MKKLFPIISILFASSLALGACANVERSAGQVLGNANDAVTASTKNIWHPPVGTGAARAKMRKKRVSE